MSDADDDTPSAGPDQDDPRLILQRWLPHLLLVVLLGLGVWLLGVVFLPVLEPILLASALALLTTHVLYRPLDANLARLVPWLPDDTRRHLAGIVAVVVLTLIPLVPVFSILASTVGSFDGVLDLLWGIITRDEAELSRLHDGLSAQVDQFDELYPALDLDDKDIPDAVVGFLKEAADFGPAMLTFVFKGTGALAQMILALVMLAFLYPQGTRLVHGLLERSPLDEATSDRLVRRHRQVVLRLLNDTVATAFVKGAAVGLLTFLVNWLLADSLLPIPVLPVAILAGVITLLPMVGVTMAWLPIAAFFWTGQTPLAVPAAIAMGLGAITLNVLIERVRHRVGRRIDDQHGEWTGFMLFLGLVGGLLSFGIKGFIIGPTAVVLVYTLISFWLPLYGLGPEVSENGAD